MKNIRSGNIITKEPNGDRGWFIGDFKDHPLPYPFFSTKFSVKYARLERGTKKEWAQSDAICQTLTVLIEGKQKVDFPETKESILLEEEGDYVFFEPGVVHSWEAVDDNLTVTFRWEAEQPPA